MGPRDQGGTPLEAPATPPAPRSGSARPATLLALAALAWGLALAPRGYGEGDASELTLALAVGGVPHPTGYPLYVLAGHLFVRLAHALGLAWPSAANAWSAVGAAVAVYFVARLAADVAAGDGRAAPRGTAGFLSLLPLGLLMPQPIWSAAATQAEVTSWHGAWVALAAWTAWRVGRGRRGAAPGPGASPAPWPAGASALVWGLVVGAGLAHHATSVLVSVPLTIWLAWRRAPLGTRFLAGVAIPLASFGWIAYRAASPAPFQWPLLAPGLDGLLLHVTGRAFGGYLGGFRPTPAEASLLLTALPWVAITLPLLGAAAFARADTPRRSFARATGVAALLQAAFLFAYRIPDPSWLAIPSLLLGAAWLPSAVASLAARAGRAAPALLLAGAALALLPPWVARDLEARRAAEETDRIVRAAWERVPFERGLVAWSNDLAPRLRAFQLLEGSHAERVVEHPGILTWERPRAAFVARYGFDPWEGAMPRTDAELPGRLVAAAARAGWSAIDFDDAIRRVRR